MYHIKGRSHEKCSLPGAVILSHVTVYDRCLKGMSPLGMQTPDIVYLLFACLYKKCYLLWVHINAIPINFIRHTHKLHMAFP